MKVRVIAADDGGCGFYRCKLPVAAVNELAPEHDIRIFDETDFKSTQPDVLVWQRPMEERGYEAIQRVQAAGVKVIIEIDDRMDALHPSNPAFAATHPRSDTQWAWKWLSKSCSIADLVTVSSDSLAAHYGAHGRVRVIRNAVPRSYLSVPHSPGNRPTVGYAGALCFHHGDLEQCGQGVALAVQDTGARFLGVGDDGIGAALAIPDAEYAPPVPLDEWPTAVAQLDVSLVPLVDTAFNRGKSWLKALESAAVGAVPVMSPLPEQVRLHDEYGIGVLARSPKDWRRAVKRLLADHDLRAEKAAHGRAVVAERLTMEHTAAAWLDAWSSVASH